MSICFYSNGLILMDNKNSDFINKFGDLCLKYDNNCLFKMNSENVIKFKLYARHYFMSEFEELVNEYINDINSGQIHFTCDDEDGSFDNPFPNYVYVEICEGKYFEQSIVTRFSYDWGYGFNSDFKDIIEERRNEVIESERKEYEKFRLENLKRQQEYEEKVKRGEIVPIQYDNLPF